MQEQDIRWMRRSQLIEVINRLTADMESLERKLEAANESLRERSLAIDESGSLAEAVMKVNKVMQAADAAAAEYIDNIRKQHEDAEAQSKEMLEKTRISCSEMEEATRARCEDMIANARQETQAYWDEVYSRLRHYHNAGSPIDKVVAMTERRAAGAI